MKEQIMQALASNQRIMQLVQQATARLAKDPDIRADSIGKMIKLFEFAIQRPDSWPEMRDQIIKSGAGDAREVPVKFDPRILMVMLAALYMLEQQKSPQLGCMHQMQKMQRG